MSLTNIFKKIMEVSEQRGSTVKVLNADEAKNEIVLWQDRQKELKDFEREMCGSIGTAMARLKEFDVADKKLGILLSKYKEQYKTRKSKIAKAKVARSLVLLHKALTKNKLTKIELSENLERADSVVEQASVLGQILTTEIKAAETYIALNGHLRLYGQALDVANQIVENRPQLEAEFEMNIDTLNDKIDGGLTDDDWIEEANKLIKNKTQ
jgi:hypothetical protein